MLVAPPLAKFALAFGPPEYFSLMLMGIVVLDLLGFRVHSEGVDDGCFRAAPRHDRHGFDFRHAASDFRASGAQRRCGFDSGHHGSFRRGRSYHQCRRSHQTRSRHHKSEKPSAQPPGLEGFILAHHPRVRVRFLHRHSSRSGSCHFCLQLLCHREEAFQASGKIRNRHDRRSRRARKRPTMPLPEGPSSRFSLWGFRPIRSSPSFWEPS